jgi:tripartite-type tricarboxylate transporter receptor subunit TctC
LTTIEGLLEGKAFSKKGGSQMAKRIISGVMMLIAWGLFFYSPSWGAEKFPTRPIELINPFGAGGFNDIHCQILSSVAQKHLGQPLIVTMKPGAGGVIGTAFAARAKPDGYTLLFAVTGPNSITCQVEDTGYTKDSFVPIAKINHAPSVVAVKADKPWKNLEDLLKYIRSNPQKVVYGTTAVTGVTNFGNYLLLHRAGIKTQLATVPFKGVGDQVLSILKGDTDYMVQVYTGLTQYIKSKEIRVLAVLDEKRLALLPDAPTAKEQGYDVISIMWGAILAPRGTPTETVDFLASAFRNMAKEPSFVSTMEKMEMPLYYQERQE